MKIMILIFLRFFDTKYPPSHFFFSFRLNFYPFSFTKSLYKKPIFFRDRSDAIAFNCIKNNSRIINFDQ